MCEGRHDFLDVMSDKDEGRGFGLAGEAVEKLKEMFAGDRIEASARFVEDEQPRSGHEGATDEDALAFTLGKVAPWAVGEGGTLDLF